MRSIILSIGDELVLGQTVDTNSAWLSQQLAAVGCEVVGHVTVGDDQRAIEHAMRDAVERCDVLLCSGGIGPTEDDLTRQALAAVMGAELELNEAWLARLEAFFKRVNRPMSPLNRIQAMIPRGATMIDNAAGTAAGVRARLPVINPHCDVFLMPGVPKEMKLMFQASALPFISETGGGAVILSRTLHTFGSGESAVGEKLGTLMKRGRNPSVGTTVSGGVVSLRLNARYPSLGEAAAQLDETDRACRVALGGLIYGQEDDTLAGAVARMLLDGKTTVATAESCTGGLLAKMLTDTPGSSTYFRQGWVTYSNEAKTAMLGVPTNLLTEYGAVSEPVVRAMAEGAARQSGAAHALAISGIAGPDGGTPQKPVGTVCIALRSSAGNDVPVVTARTFVFTGDREMIRDRSAKMALNMLRYRLLGAEMPS